MEAERARWVRPKSMAEAIGRTRLDKERALEESSSWRRSMSSESSSARALSKRVWRSERVESEMGRVWRSEGFSEWRSSSSSVTIRVMASSMAVLV